MQHRHMDTNHTYKYTIRRLTKRKNHTRTCQNKQKKTLHVQTEIVRKKLIIHLNRFDYSQLHFCVHKFLSEIAQVFVKVIILFVVKGSIDLYVDGLL